MATLEHLQILQQGVAAWNQWREQNEDIRPDLSDPDLSKANLREANLREADLSEARLYMADLREADLFKAGLHSADLSGANLTRAYLSRANLTRAILSGAILSGADLTWADLTGADLTWADLTGADLFKAHLFKARLFKARLHNANLIGAYLSGANLTEVKLFKARLYSADLSGANLSGANLSGAYLSGADLTGANLSGADLTRANLTEVKLYETVFSDTNLTAGQGLKTCIHNGPSTLDHRTLAKSGPLPLAFLQGCGLPESLIEYLPSLLGEPYQFYSCFISYASKDQAFAERLHADLQNKGVRCWFAPKDLPIGAKIRASIDETIRLYDKLLLVLSKTSVMSQWVEQEVATALARERQQGTTILFPVRIDDAVMTIEKDWPAFIRNTRNIGDFRRWKTHDVYQKALARLLRDLKDAEQQPDGSRPAG